MKSRRALVLLVWLGMLFAIGFDLTSKAWASRELSSARTSRIPVLCVPDQYGQMRMQRLPSDTREVVPGYVQLRYAENCAAMLGLLGDLPPRKRSAALLAGALVVAGAILLLLRLAPADRLLVVGCAALGAGGLANGIDRLHRGYVVDLIRFHVGDDWSYPTFNVADVVAVLGAILLCVAALRETWRAIAARRSRSRRSTSLAA